ncbi:unnamed protein product [Dibothriocephalus latus]|uniref:Uncharacterized protein n=1 Tax=Dibothriocephalus latus TaxID=60516 RepID=A0A3P7RY03_DIBLA|nr:unnamed protein product [Dibothriocephalus latus]
MRLTSAAYPSLAAADKDRVVVNHFKSSLNSEEVYFSLRHNPPGDLEGAIQRAKHLLLPDYLRPPKNRPRLTLNPS